MAVRVSDRAEWVLMTPAEIERRAEPCPLSGVKRTSAKLCEMSAGSVTNSFPARVRSLLFVWCGELYHIDKKSTSIPGRFAARRQCSRGLRPCARRGREGQDSGRGERSPARAAESARGHQALVWITAPPQPFQVLSRGWVAGAGCKATRRRNPACPLLRKWPNFLC